MGVTLSSPLSCCVFCIIFIYIFFFIVKVTMLLSFTNCFFSVRIVKCSEHALLYVNYKAYDHFCRVIYKNNKRNDAVSRKTNVFQMDKIINFFFVCFLFCFILLFFSIFIFCCCFLVFENVQTFMEIGDDSQSVFFLVFFFCLFGLSGFERVLLFFLYIYTYFIISVVTFYACFR